MCRVSLMAYDTLTLKELGQYVDVINDIGYTNTEGIGTAYQVSLMT